MYKRVLAPIITILCFVIGVAGGAVAVGLGLRWAASPHEPVAVAPPPAPAETETPPMPKPPPVQEEPPVAVEPTPPPPPPAPPKEPVTPPNHTPPKAEPQPPVPVNPVPPGPVLRRISQTEPVVSLTFDDGPTRFTPEFLAVLEEHQVPATFFWLAGNTKDAMAREVIAAGHQIGNHTVAHVRLTELSYEEQLAELQRSTETLTTLAGEPISYFRPPFGAYDANTLQILEEMGIIMVMWDVDSRDWELGEHPERIIENVMAKVRPGSIILLHERLQTLQILPDLITSLREAGYSFSPLPPLEAPEDEN